MVWLPDGENFLKICLFLSTEYINVTDGRTDGQTDIQTDRHHMTAKTALIHSMARQTFLLYTADGHRNVVNKAQV